MHRDIEKELFAWKNKQPRMPLLLRGARQVGKSYIVESFGRTQFEYCVTINFEFQPELKACFIDLDPVAIVNALELHMDQPIERGRTLLFLDEIQECPAAIMALRYFKEKMPGLHVIGAGSLLEFTLKAPNFRMPVGRVQFLYLKPLSFKEYLDALGHHKLRQYIEQIDWKTVIPDNVHQKLLQHVREYCILGGMPEVISEFLHEHRFKDAQKIQTGLLNTYRNDFGKYATAVHHKYLEVCFNKAPELVGQQLKYHKISKDFLSRDIKAALDCLVKTTILHRVVATSASGLPLNALLKENKFKLLMVDIGLMKRATRLESELLQKEDLTLINDGAVAEQYVGQELLASIDFYEEPEIYFWSREHPGSNAEVDYVIQVGSTILPIEVKAGCTGRLKSLHMLMAEKDLSVGVRISQQPLMKHDGLISVPFYLVSELDRLIT